ARHRIRPPPRPRRVLRGGRAARQAVAARQARGRRWDGRARRGRDRVVRGPAVRRPLGHVDPRGAGAVPARRLPVGALLGLPGDQPGGDGRPAGGLAPRRAALAGRGVRRPRRRRPPRPGGGDRHRLRRGAATPGAGGQRRADRHRRDRVVEVPRQGRQRARQAGRADGRAAGQRAGPPAAHEGHRDPGSGAGHGRAPAPGRHPHHRRAGAGGRGRARAARRPSARPEPVAPRAGTGPATCRAGARGQVGQLRGHLRHRPDRPSADGGAADASGARRRRAPDQGRAVGPHRDPQGEAPRLHDPQPVQHPAEPHRQRRDHRAGRPHAAGGPGPVRRRAAAGGRRVRPGRLGAGGPVRDRRRARGGRGPAGTPASDVVPGDGRGPRRDGPRLGLGLRVRRRHGAVRVGEHPAGPGALLPGRRPTAAPHGTARRGL
ncbi:MAG: DNA polymerase IV, partial [uncultured Nocardioides sp.]